MPITKKPAAKTATKKPAAKKPTAAKPAAPKNATKSTVKKTTATKPAVKKSTTKTAPTKKVVVEKVGGEISVHGRKIMQTLQKEFSKKFEYLLLCFIIDADRGKSVNIQCIDTTKTISEARKKPSDKELSMHGRSKIQTIEDYFWKELGIACQIGISNYNGHKFYFPIGDWFNEKTLTAANDWAKGAGCSKITPAVVAKACKNIVF